MLGMWGRKETTALRKKQKDEIGATIASRLRFWPGVVDWRMTDISGSEVSTAWWAARVPGMANTSTWLDVYKRSFHHFAFCHWRRADGVQNGTSRRYHRWLLCLSSSDTRCPLALGSKTPSHKMARWVYKVVAFRFTSLSMSSKFSSVRFNLLGVFLWALYYPLVLSAECSASVYGTPDVQDCIQALSWIPYAQESPSDPRSQQIRIFAEPQYLRTPFGALNNGYRPHAIVQLPKTWKHSKYI